MSTRRPKKGAGSGQSAEEGKTALGSGVAPLSGGGGIFKTAAVAVLRQERKLMTTGDITRVALERKLINCQGKTPEATMASALYTDIKKRLENSLFTRPQEGLFGLREWIDQKFYPEGWAAPPECENVAPFKRRSAGSTGARSRSGTRPAKRRNTDAQKPGKAGSYPATASMESGSDGQYSDGEDQVENGAGELGMQADQGVAVYTNGDVSAVPAGTEQVPTQQGQPAAKNSSAENKGLGDKPATEGVKEGIEDQDKQRDDDDDGGDVEDGDGAAQDTSPPVNQSRPRRAAANTTYASGVPIKRESRDGRSHSKMRDLGDVAHNDDLESPLHMLGDAALQEQEGSQQVQTQSGSKKGRMTQTAQLGGTHQDRLKMLHQIAHEATGSPPASDGNGKAPTDRRKRPRLHVQVADGAQGPHGQGPEFGYPGQYWTSPLMTTRWGPQNGRQYIYPDPSPTGLPGGMEYGMQPGNHRTPGVVQEPWVAGGSNMLYSPTAMGYTHGIMPRMPGGMSLDGTVRMNGGPYTQGPAVPYQPSPRQYGRAPHQGSADERMADAEGLRLVILRLEGKLGRANPITAKAWLALGRMFHSLATPLGAAAAVKASEALRHAAQCAQEAADALKVPWNGVPQFDTLQRLVAEKGPAAAEPTVLTIMPASAVLASNGTAGLPSLRIVNPDGTTATPQQPGSAVAPPTSLTTAAAPSTVPGLNLATPALPTHATMQVIPAAQGNAAVPTQTLPVLNLGVRDAAAGGTSSKLTVQPPTTTINLQPAVGLDLGIPSPTIRFPPPLSPTERITLQPTQRLSFQPTQTLQLQASPTLMPAQPHNAAPQPIQPQGANNTHHVNLGTTPASPVLSLQPTTLQLESPSAAQPAQPAAAAAAAVPLVAPASEPLVTAAAAAEPASSPANQSQEPQQLGVTTLMANA